MSELSFKDLLTNLVKTFEDTRNRWAMRSTGLEKTFLTKDITLQDWNSLIVLLTQTEAYVRAVAPTIEGLGPLGESFISDVRKTTTAAEDAATAAHGFATYASQAANTAQGYVISKAYLNETGQLVLHYKNGGTYISTESVHGRHGNDGISPKVRIGSDNTWETSVDNGVTWTSTGVKATGAQGPRGDGLKIDTSYETYAEMDSDKANVSAGSVVMISGVENAELTDSVAQIYLRTSTGYKYLGDLSSTVQGPEGKQGLPGPEGPTGPRGTKVIVGYTDPSVSDDLRADDVYLKIKQAIGEDSPSSLTVFRFDGENWWNRGHIQGLRGEPGTSPTIDVAESSVGYNVTFSDVNGSKTVTLFHGKSDGGSGSDPRRNTLLCDVVLGWRHYGEGNYEMYSEMPLADTILPNTSYIVNGQQVTSDGDGDIEQEVTMSYGLRGIVRISGKTVRLNILSEYDPYDECTTRVTVVGPGAFTCVAQLTALGDIGGEGWNDVDTEVTVDALSLIPYRLVYLVRENGATHTAVLDGDGNLPAVNVNTADKPLLVSITDGKLTVNGKDFSMSAQGVTLTVLAETLDVGDGGSAASGSGDSGGDTASVEVVYAPQNQYLTYKIPTNGAYLVKIEGVANALRWIVLEDGYVKHDSNPYNSDGISVNVEGNGLLWIYPESQSIYIKFEPIASFKISCFIEGTSVLLRHPSTLELYEKPIEEVLPFEYAAFWNPDKGRLDATRVLAPPIVGDAEEYDRLYFDDGTKLDVYGVQFFWNVDTDTLVDWSKMEQGTRVCTKDGDIVCFVRSEHIVPDKPVKHYTLLTYRGRYIADGIVAGDKRDLIYPRMMAPERVRYWRMLNEADQNGLIKAHQEGCRRRNWKYSRELHDAVTPYRTRRLELNATVESRKKFLLDTDHRVIKYAEGVITAEAFEPERIERVNARKDINAAESELVEVEAAIVRETERVKREILSTWKPKHAGKFVGKSKAILEES